MAGKKVVSTKTNVATDTTQQPDGSTVEKITTTTIETYADGSSSTKTKIETRTHGHQLMSQAEGQKAIPVDPNAIKNAPKADLTTDNKFIEGALQCHNELRKKHGAPPLVISKELCKIAQAWANTIAKKGKMEHSPNGIGENVYWASQPITDGSLPVKNWYSEIKDFDFNNIEHKKGTGHFTQVIWKGTKEFGIAMANAKDGATFVVANYNPQGNFVGHYKENIEKPQS